MANLVRWDPVRELIDMRRDWDRLFDDNFFRPVWSGNGHNTPLADLYETTDEVHVKAAMPGVKPEDVEIQVHGDMLTIKAEATEEEEKKEATYHMREQRYRSYSRSIMLPTPVKAEKAEAEVKDGILHVTLPKAEEAKPKVITVKATK
jgi:HSP20 family protein